jgi:bifunctional DNA-binding transcriptional regulator/antitoxin component of YhaV-PrlF toxin-antitoxin module
MSSKGQIVIPVELRELDGIQTGQGFTVERLAEGEYRLVRNASKARTGLVDWLRACPHKGALEVPSFLRRESTDDL